MSGDPVLEACAQIIPVLLLTILVDNRRPAPATLLDRPTGRPSRAESWASLRSLVGIFAAIVGEMAALGGLNQQDGSAKTVVLGSVAVLGIVLVLPHPALHNHMIEQRVPSRSAGTWTLYLGAAMLLSLIWLPDPGLGYVLPLSAKIVITVIYVPVAMCHLIKLQRLREHPEVREIYDQYDRRRWGDNTDRPQD